ncbi:MAG: hypothetical protein ABJP34_07370 [Erythrobacter sp.]
MKRIFFSAAIMLAAGISAPASACMTVDQTVTIHPLSEVKPGKGERGIGNVFKVHYSGERSGKQNKLWPNFYVVEVVAGKKKGQKALIPAHVTSCHSVHIAKGATGYVVGTWKTKDRKGNDLEMPILSTFMNGRKEKFQMFPPAAK